MFPAIGSPAPEFVARALVGDDERQISLADYSGKWVVLYFYPKDDTAVCESENLAFRSAIAEFERLDTQLLAASGDSVADHRTWRDRKLGPLPYPWIGDDTKDLARTYGVLHEDTGLALRATFIINPDGVLKYISVHDLAIGRSTPEILRTLHALASDKPTQCNWRPGEPTL
jgi:peroxiredoxin (alkyl hydroperoxide reductase subunit C)